MSKQLYLVNKTDSHLQLMQGFFHVDRGGFKAIEEAQLNHPDVIYAKNREWIEVTDNRPQAKAVPGINAIETHTPYQGMSEEELKAELSKEKAPTTKTEAIGKPAEETEAPADGGSKKGRKAAAEKAAE